MHSRPAAAIRRAAAGVSWRQGLAILCALAVIAAMVATAETAQRNAERHQHVQVMVERVRALSQQTIAIAWEGVAGWNARSLKAAADPALMNRGIATWGALSAAITTLGHEDHSASTRALERDSAAVYRAGLKAMQTFGAHDLTGVMADLRGPFAAGLGTLDRDSVAAAAYQQRVAGRALSRAHVAYALSLLIGLLVLLLVGLTLHRLRRSAALADARRAMERQGEERLRALIEHSTDLITVVDQELVVRWQSSSVERTLGLTVEQVLGMRLSDLTHPDDAEALGSQVAAGAGGGAPSPFTMRFRHANGEWRHLEAIAAHRLHDPAVGGVVLSMRDVSERKALEEELRHQAFHDSLTGLANRALFEDRLAHALAGARRHGRPIAVLFLDLDDFKTINDSLGHAIGDDLLRAVAIRIAGVVRVTDTAARLGGDEFAVLLEMFDEDGDPDLIAGRLLQALEPPFDVGGRQLRVNASIGIAEGDGTVAVEELLRNADTAMYVAKGAGKGNAQRFEPGMHERVLDRLELGVELQRAIDQEEFELDYQPIVELDTGTITGAEALVRWAHPTRGRLAPGHFIALAEETGLIVALGDWVLRTACDQAARWRREFPGRPLDLNVNVSTRQLNDPDFPRRVSAVLRDTGLPARTLVLEVTESLLPHDNHEIIDQLEQLKDIGVRVAVDDFGAGYSALSRLQSYPVDILKIDRSFIDGIEHDEGKGQLVRGIVNLGESLHLQVVAEGIEEREQADQLRRMRSPLGQGYLFSRPVGAAALEALLRDGKPLSAERLQSA
jgi:diguanylate cyclase (GGDEF)-like protein/PAS domain S-box-containing protein